MFAEWSGKSILMLMYAHNIIIVPVVERYREVHFAASTIGGGGGGGGGVMLNFLLMIISIYLL